MLWHGGRGSNITQIGVTKFMIRPKIDLKTKKMHTFDHVSTCLKTIIVSNKLKISCFSPGTVAEWVRASALSHSEWMVLSSNPGEGRNFSLLFELGMVN